MRIDYAFGMKRPATDSPRAAVVNPLDYIPEL